MCKKCRINSEYYNISKCEKNTFWKLLIYICINYYVYHIFLRIRKLKIWKYNKKYNNNNFSLLIMMKWNLKKKNENEKFRKNSKGIF